jgi:polyphosphate kinase 2 (PPK2 family)
MNTSSAVLVRSDEKKKAWLNCIPHLLSQFPYKSPKK